MSKLVALTGIAILLMAWFLAPILKAATPQSADILMQVLGGTADVASSGAFRQADVYFHGGVMNEQFKEEDRTQVKHSTIPAYVDQLPYGAYYYFLQTQIVPQVHKHLDGDEAREMLPWFILAARLNPHNIDAWRVGSYWFFRTNEYSKAFSFISQGIKKNPSDYRLYYDRGILYHKIKLWQKALIDFEKADSLWQNNSEDAPYDKHGIAIFQKDTRNNLRK
ncbi:MAG: tetratricopeptide repeat protein [Armatimonadota bacterium]